MNSRKYLEYAALAAMLFTFFAFFSIKVWDIDFWWHIAAGKQILESGVIPSTDPFGIYDAANVFGQTVLKSEWFGQVVLYSIYRWFDFDGIIFLRAGILTLCLVIVYWRCRLAETSSPFSLLMTALAGLAILEYTGERPQLFSFLYLSLIFLLLDSFTRSGKRWLLYCVPLVTLIWINTHGGAMLGMVALGLFGIGYVLEVYLVEKRFNNPQIKLIFLIAGLSAIALVLAPNGFGTFKFLFSFENSLARERVSEYTSPWAMWPETFYYWVFIGIVLVSLPGFFSKAYLKQVIVVIPIGLISMTAYRYIPLFVLLAAPYVAASLSRMLNRIKFPSVAINLFALIAALSFLAYGFKQERVFQHGVMEQKFPVGAVAFMKTHKLSGKIFNTINWGGYLIWNLSPTVTVFIDGRMLDHNRMVPYTHILWATPDGQRFFEQAHFDLMLVPYSSAFSSESYPIIGYLLSRPDWQAVYRDGAGYLFARRAQ